MSTVASPVRAAPALCCPCVMHHHRGSVNGSPAPKTADLYDDLSAWSQHLESPSRPSSPSAMSEHTDGSPSPCCSCISGCSASASCRPFAGKTVVLLRTSSTARAPVYASLRRLGLRIIMVHPFDASANFGPECIDEWIHQDTTDVDSLYATLTSPRYAGTFDAVASFDEYGVFPAARLSQRLGLRLTPLTPSMLSTVNIKSRFRHWCKRHGIAAPRFLPLMTPGVDVTTAVREAGLLFPIVVKPAPGAGSNLVTLVDDETELAAAVARLWTAIEAMRPTAQHFEALGEPIHVLLEEFVEGPEVDVDAIVEGGVVRFAGVSDNFETVRPYFSEVGGLAPSALPHAQQDALVQLLEQFVAATTAEGEALSGVLHFEAKYDTRRDVPVIIEVNCRMGSAETHTMVTGGFGVDLSEAAMRLALGMPLQPLPRRHIAGTADRGSGRYFASANLYPEKAGSLVEIRPPTPHPTLIRAMPFPMARGAPVRLPPESFGCLLWLVAEGATPSDAVRNMKARCADAAIVVEDDTATQSEEKKQQA